MHCVVEDPHVLPMEKEAVQGNDRRVFLVGGIWSAVRIYVVEDDNVNE